MKARRSFRTRASGVINHSPAALPEGLEPSPSGLEHQGPSDGREHWRSERESNLPSKGCNLRRPRDIGSVGAATGSRTRISCMASRPSTVDVQPHCLPTQSLRARRWAPQWHRRIGLLRASGGSRTLISRLGRPASSPLDHARISVAAGNRTRVHESSSPPSFTCLVELTVCSTTVDAGGRRLHHPLSLERAPRVSRVPARVGLRRRGYSSSWPRRRLTPPS